MSQRDISPGAEHRIVEALMDDGSYVTAIVERESQNPDQRGWLLLSHDALLWWATPKEYRDG